MAGSAGLARALSILIVLATVAFAVGVGIEKSEGHDESGESAAHLAAEESEGSGEAAELDSDSEPTAEEASPAEEADGGGESDEEGEILGINPESTPLVVLAVVGSLALAGGVWWRPQRVALLGLVAAAMLAFAVLDEREVFHQADESNTGLAVLASVVAALHLAAGGTSFVLAERSKARTAP